MVDNFFKDDIDFGAPIMFVARGLVQGYSTGIIRINFGDSNSFLDKGAADFTRELNKVSFIPLGFMSAQIGVIPFSARFFRFLRRSLRTCFLKKLFLKCRRK